MKKIVLAVALLITLGSVMRVSAQQQEPQKMTFYYYPSSNIYFDVASNEYVYYDDATQKWLNVKELPTLHLLRCRSTRYTTTVSKFGKTMLSI
jgi:hypothetical protein